MINVLKQVDNHSLTWETIERSAGDEMLPNIDEIRSVDVSSLASPPEASHQTFHSGAIMKRLLTIVLACGI